MILEFPCYYTTSQKRTSRDGINYLTAWFVGEDNEPVSFRVPEDMIFQLPSELGMHCILKIRYWKFGEKAGFKLLEINNLDRKEL